jgi:tRNA splicing endonuclease
MRERGLPIRMGFKECDFRVYDRGAKPSNSKPIKWIVFCSAEDYPCKINQLERAIKLSKNIKATALWAVVDNDNSITYYIISELNP